MKAVVALLVALVSVSSALVRAYSVEPVQQSWSGWTRTVEPNDKVSQIVTCCWDELDSTCYVELFVGLNESAGAYDLEVRDDSTSDLIAHKYNVPPVRDHEWLRFDTLDIDAEFTKGKKYRFTFTRDGSDSINYYTDDEDPYGHGWLKLGGTDEYGKDLSMRVYGVMDKEGMRAEGGRMKPDTDHRPTSQSAYAA